MARTETPFGTKKTINKNMRMIDLFPTPLGVYDLERKITSEEKSCIDLLLESLRPNVGNRTSQDNFVFQQKELRFLHRFCVESVNRFVVDVLQYTNLELRVTQSWLNKSVKGEYHHLHRHPNSILSGVLYIETGDNDKINFTRNVDKNSFVFDTTDWNMYNAEMWWFRVKEAELFVFPSHLLHNVPPVESESRISLSFNTFPAGSFGSADSLNKVDL